MGFYISLKRTLLMKSFKFLILILSCLLAFSTTYANTYDPCAYLNGTWKGVEKYSNRHGVQCIWDVVSTYEVHNGYVEAQMIYYNGRQVGSEGCQVSGSFRLQGSCRNAKLDMSDDWHGIVLGGDSLVLEAQSYDNHAQVRTIEQYKRSSFIKALK